MRARQKWTWNERAPGQGLYLKAILQAKQEECMIPVPQSPCMCQACSPIHQQESISLTGAPGWAGPAKPSFKKPSLHQRPLHVVEMWMKVPYETQVTREMKAEHLILKPDLPSFNSEVSSSRRGSKARVSKSVNPIQSLEKQKLN